MLHYNMTCVMFYSESVSISNFKVEKSENLDNVFLRFFEMTLQKNVTSRVFGILKHILEP